MAKYLKKVRKNLEKFDYFKIEQIPREQNSNVDALAKLASQNEFDELNLVPVEMLNEPSICEKKDVEMIDSSPMWMTPIFNYLLSGQLPTDKNEAQKLLYSVPRYMIVEGKLYRRGYSMPLLRCVLPAEANEIIKEIHESFCGDHASWFGIPIKIVSDNGTQFDGELFIGFCERNKIIKSFSSVSRPQANGQVEAVNKTLKDTIEKKLDAAKGRWVDELPQVLWAHRTTEKIATGHSPFSLAFGLEAMLPVEVNISTHRREFYNQEENQELLKLSLDLLDEKRTESQITNSAYQH
ncbi:uncharacterized protein LOC133034447 [Cannabis sativa]|uniref:uncharacterized protein LOC133034447 n=1 Tax=Cannabis sativa TaxID=3483 RepID=UPI0029CA7BB7|nr:uncharacterized protein LOC133034447 [Cannabis sativa]